MVVRGAELAEEEAEEDEDEDEEGEEANTISRMGTINVRAIIIIAVGTTATVARRRSITALLPACASNTFL